MSSALRNVLALALVSAAVALGAPGCSQQTEGERCDSAKAGDEDCDSGLTCVGRLSLLEGITDRCCPEAGTETDKRCTRGAPGGGSGGTSNAGGEGNGTAGESESTAGQAGSAGSAGSASGGSGGAGGMSGAPAAEAGAAGTPAESSAGNGAGGAG